MNYAVKQRLRFIDFLIARYGEISRGALTDFFGISIPQASKDLSEYRKIAPGNIRYSFTAKTWLKNPEFVRVWA